MRCTELCIEANSCARTYKRELISKVVIDCMVDDDQTSPAVMVRGCTDGKQSVRTFSSMADDCKHASQLLLEQYPGTLGYCEEELESYYPPTQKI